MTDRSDGDSSRPPSRRPSPFDAGFVTLWQNDDPDASRASGPRDEIPKEDEVVGERSYLLPGEFTGGVDPRRTSIEPDIEPVDIAAEALRDEEAVAERAAARSALKPVLRSLESAGLYAYITLDDENRWSVASDDERGRVDVRLDDGDFEVIMSATSPGMYADEDHAYRRKSLERLARMLIPRVARGQLAEHQSASWDEVEAGVAVRVRYVLPRESPEAIGPFVLEHFEELDELLGFIETEISR
ncbi:MAG TPA: hypothetical protein VGT61_02905 [Thermomicrobiales bacterium]|jgi:hypothetical protein|nr:hypothetical protein [Thermomicrobiales bacterium]